MNKEIRIVKDKRLKQILKPAYYKDFCEFITGQTTSDAEGCYEWDFLDWLYGRPWLD